MSVPTWPCCEVNGVVFIWFHCDGLEPQWKMPVAKTLTELKYVGRTEHIINAHIQVRRFGVDCRMFLEVLLRNILVSYYNLLVIITWTDKRRFIWRENQPYFLAIT